MTTGPGQVLAAARCEVHVCWCCVLLTLPAALPAPPPPSDAPACPLMDIDKAFEKVRGGGDAGCHWRCVPPLVCSFSDRGCGTLAIPQFFNTAFNTTGVVWDPYKASWPPQAVADQQPACFRHICAATPVLKA